jgi:hypothetical protein
MQYCNEKWFQLTGHPIVPYDDILWDHLILEEDYDSVVENTSKVITEKRTVSYTFRLKNFWTDPDGIKRPNWMMTTATVEIDAAGSVKSVIGTMTNVSQLKWAEDLQKIRAQEALESKRQQENFIDMTSHEGPMRRLNLYITYGDDKVSSPSRFL